MAITLTNQLATKLFIPDATTSGAGLEFAPNGETGEDQVVYKMTSSLLTALANGHLSSAGTSDDVKILAEQTGTGTEQTIAHGLGSTPSYVGAMVSEVPDTGYGGGSAKPFDVVEGVHDATNVKFTVATGVKYKPIVVG